MLNRKFTTSKFLLKTLSYNNITTRLIHNHPINPTTTIEEKSKQFLIKTKFSLQSDKQFDLLKPNTPLKIKTWSIPKETSFITGKDTIMIIQYGGQLFEITSMIEGMITPLQLGQDISISESDYLFDLERNELHLETVDRSRQGKILQILVKPGDWVEKDQVGMIIERNNKVEEWKFLQPGRILQVHFKIGDHIGLFWPPFTMMEKQHGKKSFPLVSYKYIGISNQNPTFRPDMLPQMYYFENHNCGISSEEFNTEIFDIEWLVKEGQEVKKGDLLCSYSVPKLRLEFMSPYDGKMTWLRKEASMFMGDEFFEIIIHQ